VREVPLSDEQKALLKRFAEVGGCVDYVLLDCGPAAGEDAASVETHRRAAIKGLEVIRERVAEYATRTSQREGIPIEKFLSIRIDPDRAACLVGTGITYAEFLGPRYDLERGRIILQSGGTIPGGIGYAYAFSDPPYTLYDHANKRRVSEDQATELFHAINRQVVGGLTPESMIFQWPDDWSSYFDSGKEWWGTFLWTVANPGQGRVVVVAASTTD
jgi:hypothetical protein